MLRRGGAHPAENKRSPSKAERITREELRTLGWGEGELSRRRKGDSQKLRMAMRLRRETTMTLGWIAHRLELGTKTHLAHLLYWQGKDGKNAS